MKILVLYYSYEGTTEKIAKSITERLDADCEKITVVDEPVKKGLGKYLWGGSQVFMKKLPEITPLAHNPADYDLIILGTPVWAGTFTPAFRSLFQVCNFAGKRTAFFYTDQGGPGHTKEDMNEKLSESTVVGSLHLKNAKKRIDTALSYALKWCTELA